MAIRRTARSAAAGDITDRPRPAPRSRPPRWPRLAAPPAVAVHRPPDERKQLDQLRNRQPVSRRQRPEPEPRRFRRPNARIDRRAITHSARLSRPLHPRQSPRPPRSRAPAAARPRPRPGRLAPRSPGSGRSRRPGRAVTPALAPQNDRARTLARFAEPDRPRTAPICQTVTPHGRKTSPAEQRSRTEPTDSPPRTEIVALRAAQRPDGSGRTRDPPVCVDCRAPTGCQRPRRASRKARKLAGAANGRRPRPIRPCGWNVAPLSDGAMKLAPESETPTTRMPVAAESSAAEAGRPNRTSISRRAASTDELDSEQRSQDLRRSRRSPTARSSTAAVPESPASAGPGSPCGPTPALAPICGPHPVRTVRR